MSNQTYIPSKAASDFFDAARETITYLAGRWADESRYENIEDYRTHLLPLAMEHGVTIAKMTKRPFGCEFTADGRRFALKCTMTTYFYKRIA